MEIIRKNIYKLLKERGLNQKDLAEGTGMSQSTISDILTKTEDPGILKIMKIAQYLNVDLQWLITGRSYKEIVDKNSKKFNKIVKLPDGKTIDERREIFKQPYIVEICQIILRFNDDIKGRIYKAIKVFEE